jgi:RNA polymerase sigma-70 factor (ECF subfamily)
MAEEVVQDALIAAMNSWPTSGIPDNPRAWVVRTARHAAIDRIRRSQRFADRTDVLRELAELRPNPTPEDGMDRYPDDRLRLLFTCCHPALKMDARVALTLRTVGGLTSDEIARAFLVERTTMQARITRAKKKIRQAGIPYEIPPLSQRMERLAGVLAVLYLVFNEGYSASLGEDATRASLSEEALHLARLVHTLCPDDRETAGLVALMALHDSRRAARTDAHGNVVLLEHQDRSLWNADRIALGLELVPLAVRGGAGPYGLQAAIAALHASAPTYADTDWPQIEALYRLLLAQTRSPVVALNHAVAVSVVHGPLAGLRLLDELAHSLDAYHLLHAARGALLADVGRIDEAREAYTRALGTVGNDPERRFLEARLAGLHA